MYTLYFWHLDGQPYFRSFLSQSQPYSFCELLCNLLWPQLKTGSPRLETSANSQVVFMSWQRLLCFSAVYDVLLRYFLSLKNKYLSLGFTGYPLPNLKFRLPFINCMPGFCFQNAYLNMGLNFLFLYLYLPSTPAAVGFLTVSSGVTMSAPFFLGKVIDTIYNTGTDTETMTASLTSLCIMLTGVFLCGGAANAARVYLMQISGETRRGGD